MWELFSRGAIPYTDKTTKEAFDAILGGELLPRPKECPEDLFSWVLRCWEVETSNRINMQEMCQMYRENFGNALEITEQRDSQKDMGHYVTTEALRNDKLEEMEIKK